MLFSIQINILILLLISISSNSQSQDYCLDQASICSPYFYEKCCLGFTFYSFFTLFFKKIEIKLLFYRHEMFDS